MQQKEELINECIRTLDKYLPAYLQPCDIGDDGVTLSYIKTLIDVLKTEYPSSLPAGEGVDVEALAAECVKDLGWQDDGTAEPNDIKKAFIAGFSASSSGKGYTKDDLISLIEDLKNYTRESGNILGYDEREAIEFVELWQSKHKSLPAATGEGGWISAEDANKLKKSSTTMTQIKQTTVLQELIEYANSLETMTKRTAVNLIINKATELLEKEREIIEDTFNKGWMAANEQPKVSYGKDYFTNTFKQN